MAQRGSMEAAVALPASNAAWPHGRLLLLLGVIIAVVLLVVLPWQPMPLKAAAESDVVILLRVQRASPPPALHAINASVSELPEGHPSPTCTPTSSAASRESSAAAAPENKLVQWARLHQLDMPAVAATADPHLCPQAAPSLQDISRLRIAVVALSTDTPRTLNNSMTAWAASGLLDLMDDKVMWLNAAKPRDVAAAAAFGFRVVALTRDTLPALVANRTRDRPARPPRLPSSRPLVEWPFVNSFPGDRPALRVGMSNWFAFHETDADIVLWLEKDFVPPPYLQTAEIARALLLAVASVHGGAGAVRLRRHDDPDREGIFDCCASQEYCNFNAPCSMQSHLAWQTAYCAADRVVDVSGGHMRECVNELALLNASAFQWPLAGRIDYSRYHQPTEEQTAWLADVRAGRASTHLQAHAANATPQAAAASFHDDDGLRRVVPEPLRMQCTTFRFSQWTSNVLMVNRRWWLQHVGPIAAWTDDRMFEHYMIGALPACTSPEEGVSAPVCMLLPGVFWHVEVDGRRRR